MKIDFYTFGKIIIDGKTYSQDVVIFPDKVESPWWREEGHRLQKKDITPFLKEKPELLIIGTGYYGVMEVPDEVKHYLDSQGVNYFIEKTQIACDKYNEVAKDKKVIALLHLTC